MDKRHQKIFFFLSFLINNLISDWVVSFPVTIQLQDILKFGVDKLLNDETEEEIVDFSRMLGPTVGGEWQTEEAVKDQEEEEGEEEEGEVGLEMLVLSTKSFKLLMTK